MKKLPIITFEEYLAEMERVSGDDNESKTTVELSEMWGCTPEKARKFLRRGIAEGRIVATRKTMINLAGVLVPVPSFRLIPLPRKAG